MEPLLYQLLDTVISSNEYLSFFLKIVFVLPIHYLQWKINLFNGGNLISGALFLCGFSSIRRICSREL